MSEQLRPKLFPVSAYAKGCTCDADDARLCWRVREALARAAPDAANPKCYCACHDARMAERRART